MDHNEDGARQSGTSPGVKTGQYNFPFLFEGEVKDFLFVYYVELTN